MKIKLILIAIIIATFSSVKAQEINCEQARKIYLEQNPDVARARMDAWEHFTTFGKKEGRKWYVCSENDVDKNTQVEDGFSNKNKNINSSRLNLKILNPNKENCRCELARYLSLSYQYAFTNMPSPNNTLEMQAFLNKCNGSGYYDDFEGLTQEEVFKYGSISKRFSPFQGNINKKLNFKYISKILRGDTKSLPSPSPFLFYLQ